MTKYGLPFCLLLVAASVGAQSVQPSVVNTAGGSIQNSTLIFEWSLGEIATTTIDNNGGLVTQGFLQPKLDHVNATSASVNDGSIEAFPNPVGRHLFFKTDLTNLSTITVSDLLGRRLLTAAFAPDLDMHQFPSGLYFISILDSKGLGIKTFKIIKH